MSKLHKRALVLLIAALMPGCADQSTPPPATSILLDKLPRVANSRASPCWQQREIAAQNSYIATFQNGGKETVFKAPCDVETKKIARAK